MQHRSSNSTSMKGCLAACAAALTIAVAGSAGAATVTIVNLDGFNEGFNDTTSAAPVGGNTGTTLGEQRLQVFEYAAALWGERLDSDVEIRVGANFDPLFCNSSSAVLGSAGPETVHRDFAGAPLSFTWYVQALANSHAGADLAPGSDDVGATFNSTIGTTCSFPLTWYHGLDGNPPGGTIDLVSVVLHEIGHGLGFLSLVDLGSGQKFGGFDDAYMFNLSDHDTGEIYPDMTNGARINASVSTGDLHWVAPVVVAGSGDLVSGVHPSGHVEMYAPSPAEPGSSVSHYSTSLSPDELMEPSYTGPNHDLTRTLQLFEDLGWQVLDPLMCGDATEDGNVQSSDALVALATAVGNDDCIFELCDVDSSTAVTSTDAMIILQYAVGQPVPLQCP